MNKERGNQSVNEHDSKIDSEKSFQTILNTNHYDDGQLMNMEGLDFQGKSLKLDWYKDGQLMSREGYDQQDKKDISCYRTDGRLWYQVAYDSNLKALVTREWHNNDKLRSKLLSYDDGTRVYLQWSVDGKLLNIQNPG